jgi:hypothetical protein
MSERDDLERLLALLGGDRDLLEQLRQAGFLPREAAGVSPEQADLARVAHTLVHELEVNWAGVEVALHLRGRLMAIEAQLSELVVILHRRSRER